MTRSRSSSVTPAKSGCPGARSITNARGSSHQPYTARDPHARVVHQRLGRHLVAQRPHAGNVDPLAPHAELEPLVVALDVDEPDRAPARLTLDRDHVPADVIVDPAPDPDVLRLHAVTLGTPRPEEPAGGTDSGGRAAPGRDGDPPFSPYRFLARVPIHAPAFAELVDEMEPAAAQVARIDGAEHQFALRMIGYRDTEAVIEQLDLDAHVGPGVAHDIAYELRDDDARCPR